MDVLSELQQQRESLKQNIHEMNENIKKLTGRDPAESRRLSVSKRVQLKRNSFGGPGDNNTPSKRANTERRRWGNTAMTRANNLDSGGEEQEEKKPAIQSSVVVTGKPIEPLRPLTDDTQTKKRNKRMFGLLMGTLNQFKKESQVKTEQESRREEKLLKVDEQVQKDKDDAVIERRELFNTRRGKQQELRNIEFRIEMAQLNEELKSHYDKISDFIQLKSTPRIFYKPAEHNKRTTELLKESQNIFKESLEQRMREISMCTEEETLPAQTIRSAVRSQIKTTAPSAGKSVNDPIIIDQAPSQRDLFAEDADLDQQERADVSAVTDGADSASASAASTVVVVDEPSVPESMEDIGEPLAVIVEEVESKQNELVQSKGDDDDAGKVGEVLDVDGVVGAAGGNDDGGVDMVDISGDKCDVVKEDLERTVESLPVVQLDNIENVGVSINVDEVSFNIDDVTMPEPVSVAVSSVPPKTEDEALHDEFAAQLLEEPVDRRVVLETDQQRSFSVVDERVIDDDVVDDGHVVVDVVVSGEGKVDCDVEGEVDKESCAKNKENELPSEAL